VRRFYEAFGLAIKKKMKEPDDHIGLELLFVAHLCSLISAEIEKNESDRQIKIIEELKRFLSTHLLRWISLFLERVEKRAQTDYFLATAYLTGGTVNDISDFLKLSNPSARGAY
jgi:TorA maturation chaperone TorD